MDIDQYFDIVKPKHNLNITLKPEQKEILENLLIKKCDTFGFLPTGYGKSLTYMIPPLLLDELQVENAPHIALVVSPLRSLMADQVSQCRQKGISAVAITRANEMSQEDKDTVRNGTCSVIFLSPESIDSWLPYIKVHRNKICVLAIDEVHCASEW